MFQPLFSVIVPVYREERRIQAFIAHVAALPAPGGMEIIVVDGDPEQRTLALLSVQEPCLALAGPKGRGKQMNAGAQQARGEILLFLHADTCLPQDAFSLIQSTLTDPLVHGGAFSLTIQPQDNPAGLGLRIIAWAANLRTRLTRAPYGDQAIFLRRGTFEAVGGYADIPVMEDLELMTRLRRQGLCIRILPQSVRTSARRWEREGLWRCTGRNLLLRTLYHLGVSPERLVRFYP